MDVSKNGIPLNIIQNETFLGLEPMVTWGFSRLEWTEIRVTLADLQGAPPGYQHPTSGRRGLICWMGSMGEPCGAPLKAREASAKDVRDPFLWQGVGVPRVPSPGGIGGRSWIHWGGPSH